MAIDDEVEGGMFRVTLDGMSYDVPRFCPHRGGRLDHGEVNVRRKTIRCPLHRSVFSIVTGDQLGGPPCGRLAIIPLAARRR
jgi:nitrite reductase/ring-hydroxylating ferredoxin subunit